MRLIDFGAISMAAVFALMGCKSQQNDADAIRAGIVDHLTSLKTLNLSAMDMNVTSLNIQGNHAQAQVEFRPKSGAPADAGMQVSYALDKQNGSWMVSKTLATAGAIEHPPAGANPHSQAGQAGVPGIADRPMFQELWHRGAPQPTNTLLPGHPPISSRAAQPSAAAAQP
jgi:hypothetical protein